MKRTIFMTGLLVAFLLTVFPASASSPTISGEISGVEICPQFICHAAVFQGTCDCTVNNRQTIGFFWVSIQHEPLSEASAITGGKWTLTTRRGNCSGKVTDGTITSNGNNTFTVIATPRLTKGGKGNMIVSGVLDHTEFPPTFEGELVQP
jgi:hypothetical protein